MYINRKNPLLSKSTFTLINHKSSVAFLYVARDGVYRAELVKHSLYGFDPPMTLDTYCRHRLHCRDEPLPRRFIYFRYNENKCRVMEPGEGELPQHEPREHLAEHMDTPTCRTLLPDIINFS